MVNRKSKSGGQSHAPKQSSGGGGGGGGASRASNPQAASKPKPAPTPRANTTSGSGSSKPPSSSSGGRFGSQVSSGKATAPKPQQPQANAQRPSNGPKHPISPGNTPPKSHGGGANASKSSSFTGYTARVSKSLSPDENVRLLTLPLSSATAMFGQGGTRAPAAQDRSVNQAKATSPPATKRNTSGSGPNVNNAPQNVNLNVQGRSSQPNMNTSPRNDATKPKNSQGFFGGLFSASNSAVPPPSRPTNVQQSHAPAPKVTHGATIPAKKAFEDQSPTSKQSGNGHAQPPARNAQSHAPTAPKKSSFFSTSSVQDYQQQSAAGKNTTNNVTPPPKVQVDTATNAQHSSRGNINGGRQSYAAPAQGSEKASDKSQQQHHKAPQGHKDTPPPKPSTNQGNRPTERTFVSTVFSLLSKDGPEAKGNPSHKSHQAQQGREPPPSRPAQETSNKDHKNSSAPQGPRAPAKDQQQGQFPRSETVPVLQKSKAFPADYFVEPNGTGNKSQSVNVAKSPGSNLNPGIISTSGNFFSPAAKKEGGNVAKGRANSALNLNAAAKPPVKDRDRPQGQSPRTESVLPTPKASPSNLVSSQNGTGNQSKSVKVVDPPQSTLNPGIISSGNLQSPAAKKKGPNVAKAPDSANVSKAAPAPVKTQTWGEMFSSWFLPSAEPVAVQASNKSTSSSSAKAPKVKDPGPKPQPLNSTKANAGRAESDPVQDLFILREPVPSTKVTKNGLQDLPNMSNWGISSSAASPKKEQAPTRHNILAQSDTGPRRISSASDPKKHETATTLISASDHTKDRSQISTKPQVAAVSSTSKDVVVPVLSQDDPKKTTGAHKDLLRQHAPTLRWRDSDTPKIVSAYSTLTAAPLPSPPKNELQNKVAQKTISKNPDLFKIVTPIKADVFEEYTKDHPNQPFVQSVARGLKDGFWPWADTSDPSFPKTHDGSGQGSRITREDKAEFIQKQRDDEMELERWSKPFGEKLLPGMHSAPINVVPKSTPGKFRLIVDQSRGPHSLNSTIEKNQVKVKLDSIHDLGNELLAARKKYPDKELLLFKSDVKSAYRQLPVHPLWQIKQAIPVDGQYHIDRCNTFGNRGGGWNWDSLSSSVNWIATEKKGVSGLLGYVDDNFGWELAGNRKFYKPYNKSLPAKQARLLELWDELGIPHDEEKQLSGPSLPILGYQVDASAMNVKVPDEKKAKVVNLLRSNAHAGKRYTQNELQSVAGSVSSALSLYPQLRPGLRVLFDEMSAQPGGTTKMTVSEPVARSLSSLADFLERAPPVPIRQQKDRVRQIEAGTK